MRLAGLNGLGCQVGGGPMALKGTDPSNYDDSGTRGMGSFNRAQFNSMGPIEVRQMSGKIASLLNENYSLRQTINKLQAAAGAATS